MGQLAVLSERLAVVREHRDHGVALVARGAKPGEQPPELRIRERDLAVVRPPGELRPIGLGRIVGSVRIVEVRPDEEGRLPGLGEPAEGIVHDLVRPALGARARDRALLEVLGEDVEPLPEAEGGRHRIGPYERGRTIALGLEQRGESLVARIERKDDVVADAVDGRVQAGEDRGVRGARERHRALGLLEPDAAGGQGIQGRGRGLPVAVDADVIGAQRVDRDEQQVRPRRPTPREPVACESHCQARSMRRQATATLCRRKEPTRAVPGAHPPREPRPAAACSCSRLILGADMRRAPASSRPGRESTCDTKRNGPGGRPPGPSYAPRCARRG